MEALRQIDSWGAAHAVAALVDASGEVAAHGDRRRQFRLASVTKLLTAYAALIAIADGAMSLDEPAGPPGSTVRHLLGHASGLPFEGSSAVGRPETTRIYSNTGFDLLAAHLVERTGQPYGDWLRDRVFRPLRMDATRFPDGPAIGSSGASAPLSDLVAFAAELLDPTLLPAELLAEATRVAFPGLNGILPGVGRFDPLDWGLGFELRDGKSPHWTGRRNSPRTFGHFGGAGTFLWVDPVAGLALVGLTDRGFGPWALEAWPALADAVLALT